MRRFSASAFFSAFLSPYTLLSYPQVAGIPESNVRFIATSAEDNYALSPAALRSAVEADVAAGLLPFFLCATVSEARTSESAKV